MAGPVELSGEPPPRPCQVPQRRWRQSPHPALRAGHPGHCLQLKGPGQGRRPACLFSAASSQCLGCPWRSSQKEVTAAGPGCGPDLHAGGFPFLCAAEEDAVTTGHMTLCYLFGIDGVILPPLSVFSEIHADERVGAVGHVYPLGERGKEQFSKLLF